MNGVMDVKNLGNVAPFITKDGSEIRELLAHRNSAIRNQSLAEARLAPGASTQEHFHAKTEEILSWNVHPRLKLMLSRKSEADAPQTQATPKPNMNRHNCFNWSFRKNNA